MSGQGDRENTLEEPCALESATVVPPSTSNNGKELKRTNSDVQETSLPQGQQGKRTKVKQEVTWWAGDRILTPEEVIRVGRMLQNKIFSEGNAKVSLLEVANGSKANIEDVKFCSAYAIDVDNGGTAYIADTYSDCVYVASEDGTISAFPKYCDYDSTFCYKSILCCKNGDILVSQDNDLFRVDKLASVSEIPLPVDDMIEIGRMESMVEDGDGVIIFADSTNNAIRVLDLNQSAFSILIPGGMNDTDMMCPTSVTKDEQSGDLFVADSQNNCCIKRFIRNQAWRMQTIQFKLPDTDIKYCRVDRRGNLFFAAEEAVWKSKLDGSEVVKVADFHLPDGGKCSGLAVHNNTLYILTKHTLKKLRIVVRWNPQEHANFPTTIKQQIKVLLMAHLRICGGNLCKLPKELIFNFFSFLTTELIP